jgi:hypothetical protein
MRWKGSSSWAELQFFTEAADINRALDRFSIKGA